MKKLLLFTSILLSFNVFASAVDLSKVTNKNLKIELDSKMHDIVYDRTENGVWIGHHKSNPLLHTYISTGSAGTIGSIATPTGTHHIETDTTGDVYTVNINSLKPMGFNGDQQFETPLTISNEIVAKGTVTSANTPLQTALLAVQAAQAAVNKDTADNAAATSKLTADTNAYLAQNKLIAIDTIAVTNTTGAANATALADLATAKAQLLANTSTYYADMYALDAIRSKLTADTNTLNAATAAYNALLVPVPVTVTTTNSATPIVDIMVVYTTANKTQAYALQRIQMLVVMSNQAYVDSKINLKLRL